MIHEPRGWIVDTTQASLLGRIKDRADSAAWREFDAIYRPMLHRFAMASGLDNAEAGDVVQHCMAAISRHIDGFEYDPGRGRFRSWLRTLVNNRVRNIARDRHDLQAESQDFKRPQRRETTPEEHFDRLCWQEHLNHCLDRVRSEVEELTFEAFQAYVIDEQPVDQVCATLNMTPNQVRLIKWRLTNKLRHHMMLLLGEDYAGLFD